MCDPSHNLPDEPLLQPFLHTGVGAFFSNDSAISEPKMILLLLKGGEISVVEPKIDSELLVQDFKNKLLDIIPEGF